MITKESVNERCPTGIKGFDNLCQGGLVKNSVNVLLGGPGTGKTTFLLNFLWNGCKMFNENGLFISFEPDLDYIRKDAASFGWNFRALEKEGKCVFIKIPSTLGTQQVRTRILSAVKRYGAKRLCIDPIDVFSLNTENRGEIRAALSRIINDLKQADVTSLFSDETIETSSDSLFLGDGDTRTRTSKFVADGLIDMYSSGLGGGTDRAIRIEKMRRTNHKRGPQPFKITDKGILIG